MRSEAFYARGITSANCSDGCPTPAHLLLLLEHLQALVFDTLVGESVILEQAAAGFIW